MEMMRDENSESLRINGSRNDVSLLGGQQRTETQILFILTLSADSFVQAGQPFNPDSKYPPISPAAVFWNVFVFIMAGYETSANTLAAAMTLLACRPDLQRHLQADIDRILGDRPSSNWSYHAHFPQLLDGYLGAVLNETLRLYSILPFVPKTTRERPQPFSANGRGYVVPAGILILVIPAPCTGTQDTGLKLYQRAMMAHLFRSPLSIPRAGSPKKTAMRLVEEHR